MKTIIYIEDGITQLILTPESSFEKELVSRISHGKHVMSLYTGGFYDCQGGWIRQGNQEETSLMIRLDTQKEATHE